MANGKRFSKKISRRAFITATAAGGGTVYLGKSLGLLSSDASTARTSDAEVQTVRTTCSPNCTGLCGIEAQVENGQLKTIRAAADYPEPEYNPRTCLKGLSMHNLVYGPDRLKSPLIRTGPRGKGQFKEVDWNEALDYVADKLKKIMEKYGPDSVGVIFQVGGCGYIHKGAMVALSALSGWSVHHAYDQNGDLPMFYPQTFGVQTEEFEPLEWLSARHIVVFGSNILATRLPDAHFLIEAKKKGAKLVVVDPNFSPTASKADEWIALEPNTDGALALGVANEIVKENLHDQPFLKTHTDAPLLVRGDNGKRLKASEVKGLAETAATFSKPSYRELFVAWDDGVRIVNPEDLTLVGDPAIEGEFEIELTDGQKIKCKPVFELLKETLGQYEPEKVAKITRVDVKTIKRLAIEMATLKPLQIIFGASCWQYYHGDLKGRSLALIPVLTGNIGNSGAGISCYAGTYKIRFKVASWWSPQDKKPNYVPFLYFLNGPTGREKAKYPKAGFKALIASWGNPFDQHNMDNRLRKMATEGDLELVVAIDFQKTTTVEWSDVVLPGVTWFEKKELVVSPVHPYLQLQNPAIKPLFKSKPELWIVREIARRLNPDFEKHFFPEEKDPNRAADKAIELLLKNGGPPVAGITREMLEKGPVRVKSPVPENRVIPFYEQIHDKKPFPPVTYPFPIEKTAEFIKSGRIEFYKDEDVFLELKEELPVFKPPFEDTEYKLNPKAREKYKFFYLTRNAIYRVHSVHSNNPWMNELQRFKPAAWINPDDAKRKKIKDRDRVEIYNDRGKVFAHAVLDPGVRQGTVIFEQGWWSEYTDGTSFNSLVYPWIKPTHEVYFLPGVWSPSSVWNECLCDVRKAGEPG